MEKKENSKQATSTQCDDKEKCESKKYNFYRKPSIKKKVPEVKHTLTSLKRMMKANPLLKYEMEGADLSVLSKQLQNLGNGQNGNGKISNTSYRNIVCAEKQSLQPNFNKGKPLLANIQRSQSFKNPTKPLSQLVKKETLPDISTSKQMLTKNGSARDISKQSGVEFGTKFSTKLKNCSIPRTARDTKTTNNKLIKNTTKKLTQDTSASNNKPRVASNQTNEPKKQKPVRRSLSAQHLDRKRGIVNIDQKNCFSTVQCTLSLEDISTLSPITELSQDSTLVFKTPSAYERRSISKHTPRSVFSNRRLSYYPKTPLPSLNDLQKRLNTWLVKRGKCLSSFHHLQYFGGLDKNGEIIDEENKENIEVVQDLDKGSYEELMIEAASDCGNSETKNNQQTSSNHENGENIANAALEDLLKLIQDGYPGSQCASWLELIREKYQKLEEEPLYWECRAAVEQCRGNITTAVQCYQTAILQGAEIKSVDESLDMLLHKFSLLNITTNEVGSEKSAKEKARIVKDARNVFKSSIIQFAVQERKLKKNSETDDGKKFIATPVRRSTRLSRTTLNSTPNIKICSSLQELDPSDREMLEFKKNKALV